MKIIDCRQNSPEWTQARLGKVTASEADALVSPEGKIRTGAGPQAYLYRKLTEKILGFQLNDFGGSFDMTNGSLIENEALPWLAFAHDFPVERVGFCTDDAGRYGFSPDGLIGEDGGVEVKSPRPDTHLQYLMEGVVPKDYVVQVQFSLYVSQRKWWKFLSYSRQFPQLLIHVEPDPVLQRAINIALFDFLCKFDFQYAKITAMRDAERAVRQAAYDALPISEKM